MHQHLKSILRCIFDEKGAKKEFKWQPKGSPNGAKVVPRSVKDENGEHAKSAVGYCKNQCLEPCRAAHLGSKCDKKCLRIEVEIESDLKVDLGAKMEPKLSPKGSQMGTKSEKNRSRIVFKIEVDL